MSRIYIPDFILQVDDGRGAEDLLNLIVEIRGRRRENANVKRNAMNAYWVPGVNNLGGFGRWAFAKTTEAGTMGEALDAAIKRRGR